MDARTYYNEIDPAACEVLREFIRAGIIAPGDVDSRSIADVEAADLVGYTQCHFFAGAGLWSVSARLAGWPDSRALWSGSCPCQPFSAAGKGLGTDDPRHLWPHFHRLIRSNRPPVVVGEQVAGKAGYGWFDGVRVDLAGSGYAGRCVDVPACAVDAPHQRQRLYWLAVVNPACERRGQGWAAGGAQEREPTASGSDVCSVLGDCIGEGLEGHAGHGDRGEGWPRKAGPIAAPDGRNGSWWADAEWLECRHDGKARRAKPGTPMLVNGLVGRADLWRIAGNAIVPQLAAEVLAAYLDVELSGEP